ncbi:MAG: PH domain-containing protein [Haloplanus sp.]
MVYHSIDEDRKAGRDQLKELCDDGEEVALIVRDRSKWDVRFESLVPRTFYTIVSLLDTEERIAVTNRRILRYKVGPYGRDIDEYRLDDVSSVELNLGSNRPAVEVSGPKLGVVTFHLTRQEDAREFANEIRNRIPAE